MNNNREEKLANETSKWLRFLLPLISTALGSGALWYAWVRYNMLMNRTDSYWYGWIQVALIAFMGILCLSATVLSISGRSSGWSVFKLGLSIVPLLLFSNLVILVFRIVQSIMQGNAKLFFDRLLTQPQKLILIPIVIIVLLLLGALSEQDKHEST